MTYRESLSPWAIARLLPDNLQWVIIARYRNRSDADGHLQLLRRRVPQIRFEIIWDLPQETGETVGAHRRAPNSTGTQFNLEQITNQ
ncbi:MAG: hypothetical protein WA919_15760 [Coleofasciculaceae cyanobacterium]